jgi:hypothetical protein
MDRNWAGRPRQAGRRRLTRQGKRPAAPDLVERVHRAGAGCRRVR